MLSSINLGELAISPTSRYVEQARYLIHKPSDSIQVQALGTLLGILQSAATEWTSGLLEPLEHRFVGRTLGGFLKDAARLMTESPPQYAAAAVLASAVLEDSVRRLCLKHGLSAESASLEGCLDSLKSRGVITKSTNKRLKGFAGVRDASFHAHWEQLSQTDASQLIEVLEDFLEAHFGERGDCH